MRGVALFLFALAATSGPAQAQQRTHTAQGPIRFQPKLVIGSEAPKLYEPRQNVTARVAPHVRPAQPTDPRAEDTEIICGMKLYRKHPDTDPKIVFTPPPNVRGAIRRIQPESCKAK